MRKPGVVVVALVGTLWSLDASAIAAVKCGTDSCKSFDDCPVTNPANLTAISCFGFTTAKTCKETIEQAHTKASAAGYALSPADDDDVRNYFSFYSPDDTTCPAKVNAIQKGWLDSAIWVGPRSNKLGGQLRFAAQILPSFSIGVPVWIKDDPINDAGRALGKVKTVAGIQGRFTPLGFLLSVDAFLATTDVSGGSALDTARYPSPFLLLYGGGVDALGGLVSVSYVWAQLRTDGAFSDLGSKTRYVQVGVDLTSLTLGLASGAKSLATTSP